jgi:tripartite-type tricarboxylate transporter receptor subunit TctC
MKIRHFLAAVVALVLLSPVVSQGQDTYPSKPIQMVVGFPPGGSTDVLIRPLANEAKKFLGQEIVILNKPGATGTVAAAQVATSKPDGYTLGVTPSSSFLIAPFLQDLPTDLVAETVPVLSFGKFNNAFFSKSDSQFQTLKSYIEFAKQNPGKASYGYPGVGSTPHLVMSAIVAQEDLKVNMVAFQGGHPTTTALVGGHVMLAGSSGGEWLEQFKAGQIKLLAFIDDERVEPFTDVPTVVELGYPYPFPLYVFIYGPKGLPTPIIKKLEDAFNKASQAPAFKELCRNTGLSAKRNIFHQELVTFLPAEKAKIGQFMKKFGLAKQP